MSLDKRDLDRHITGDWGERSVGDHTPAVPVWVLVGTVNWQAISVLGVYARAESAMAAAHEELKWCNLVEDAEWQNCEGGGFTLRVFIITFRQTISREYVLTPHEVQP